MAKRWVSVDVAVGRVALLQLDHPRGQVGRPLGVEPVGHRRVEHLLPGLGALAEVVGRAHPLDQVGRDRLAGRVGREGLQDVGVPGPLLEHLARRLDEVPLGGDAGEPGPADVPAEHVVDQVAELVEERHHVVVLHQAGAEVADQRALGQLAAGHAVGDRELRGVLVLALARVQVEVDPAEALAVGVGSRRRLGNTSYAATSSCQTTASSAGS